MAEARSDDSDESSDIYSKLAEKRILFISEEITVEIASKLCANLIWLDLQNKKKEIVIYINCEGGHVSGLWSIYDTIQSIQSPVKTICVGYAFSSAAIILMAGTKGLRCAYPHASIMIHSIQTEIMGNQVEVEEESKRNKKENLALMETMALHSGQSLRKVKKDCKNDKYFNADEALKYGIIDQIVLQTKDVPILKKVNI